MPLACDLLDDSEFRPGFKISVQPAVFDQKNEDQDGQKKRKKVDKNLVKRRLEQMQRKVGWDDELEQLKSAEKNKRIVVLRHMFTSQELEEQPELLLEIKDDIRAECAKFGEVTNVRLFEVDCGADCRTRATEYALSSSKTNYRLWLASRETMAGSLAANKLRPVSTTVPSNSRSQNKAERLTTKNRRGSKGLPIGSRAAKTKIAIKITKFTSLITTSSYFLISNPLPSSFLGRSS